MKRWNKITMVWNESESDVLISSGCDKGQVYSFRNEVSSEPDGTGKGELSLYGQVGKNKKFTVLNYQVTIAPSDQAIIAERFCVLETRGINFTWGTWKSFDDIGGFYGDVGYVFPMVKSEHFTDTAVIVVRAIAEALGTSKDRLLFDLSQFGVIQETFFRRQKKWISFTEYLGYRHGLYPLEDMVL